jgi:hypothetical protein
MKNRVVESIDSNIITITANCFEQLNNSGLPTDFIEKNTDNSYLAHNVNQILAYSKIWFGRKLNISFYQPQTHNEIQFPTGKVFNSDGRAIRENDFKKMRERSVAVSYNLKNLWQRLDYKLVNLRLEFGFIDVVKGENLVLTGQVDENFWQIEDLQKAIKIKLNENNRVVVCPEWMPKLTNSQEKELSGIINNLNNEDEEIMVVRKPGRQEIVTIRRDKNWYLIFLDDSPNLIFGKENLLKLEIKDLEVGKEKLVIIKEKTAGGSLTIQKNNSEQIVFFIGNLPKPTSEQEVELNNIINSLKINQSKQMKLGSQWEESGSQKIVISKHERRVAVIPAYIPKELTKEENLKLLNIIKTVKDEHIMIIPENPIQLTDLSKIAELSESFVPESPSKR